METEEGCQYITVDDKTFYTASEICSTLNTLHGEDLLFPQTNHSACLYAASNTHTHTRADSYRQTHTYKQLIVCI